jgi:pSer/pThr/pTyr-binding forkhead associated (FHA) protein
VWVDEEWFAARGEGRCPTVGEPRTFPIADGALIGRRSKSRNIEPDVDCSADGSVSGRQATLGFDGARWTITDLGSTNGTFVAHAGAPLPADPIEPNAALELEPSDRILIGAHTRVVIRAETDAEAAAATP